MEARFLDGTQLRVTQDPREIHDALERKTPIWVELQRKDEACDGLLSGQPSYSSQTRPTSLLPSRAARASKPPQSVSQVPGLHVSDVPDCAKQLQSS
jgi:hypothetical protein